MATKSTMAASIGAAAAMLGCSLPVLKRAKKAGAAGFRANGSVNVTELREWLAANPADEEGESKEALECRKLKLQCERLEHDLAVTRGEYTHNDKIREDNLRIGAATRAALQTLKGDVPTWEGLSAAEMQIRIEERVDRICVDLHDAHSRLYA